MSAADKGGPAFPHTPDRNQPTCIDGFQLHTPGDYPGMTLRDYFAAKALAALIAKSDKDSKNCGTKAVPTLARFAYEYADAMLAERAK